MASESAAELKLKRDVLQENDILNISPKMNKKINKNLIEKKSALQILVGGFSRL